MMRAIEPLQLPFAPPAPIATAPPRVLWIAPTRLCVDETYQRSLSERSIELIARIVQDWDWRRFKAPVVAEVDGSWQVIDGQHTAIAAVTHGGIAEIPVLVVAAAEIAERARAFVGLNRDRLNVTPMQIFRAELAAGDDDARTIAKVCERAGVRLLAFPPSHRLFRPGDTLALSTVRKLIDRRGAMGARVVLQALREAQCAPVSAALIRAFEELLYGGHDAGEFSAETLSLAVRAMGGVEPAEVRAIARERRVPAWRAWVIHLASLAGAHDHSDAA
jgi:hypothetical protein